MQISGAIAPVQYTDVSGNPVVVTSANPLPTSGGGGGGGGSLSDTVFIDSTGQLFVYRDTGTGTPTAYAIPAWTVYTPTGAVTESGASEETQQDMALLLTRMLNYFNAPQGYDKSLQRYRQTAVVESGVINTVSTVTTVTTVTTVSTVSAVTAVGTLNNYEAYMARMQVLDTNRTAWAQCVRARIT
jgi:hypothetical protein